MNLQNVVQIDDPFDGLGDWMISEDAIDAFDWRISLLVIEMAAWLEVLLEGKC